MPDTTTAVGQCSIAIHLEDDAGVLVDISGSANSANLDFTKDAETYTVFGSTGTKRMTCRKDATLSMNVVYTTGENEAWDLLKDWWFNHSDESRQVRIMVPGEIIGADDYQGAFQILNLSIPMDSAQAGPILVSVELGVDGDVTLGTVAT